MRNPLRTGVIGCGRVTALRHLPALSRLDGAEVVALADTDAACLKQIADRFHIPNRYPDVRALLKDTMVDVIAVCVPVQFHAEIALAAFGAEKHVFIEKPLTATLEEADRIRDRAKQVDRKVLMGFNFRWHRLIRQARALLQREAVGQVEAIRTVFASAHEAPPGGNCIVLRAEVRSSIRQFTSSTSGDSCWRQRSKACLQSVDQGPGKMKR